MKHSFVKSKMKFQRAIMNVDIFCNVFSKDKLVREFIKLKFKDDGHVEFLSKCFELKYKEVFHGGKTFGYFNHTIVIVGAYSDGTDLVIRNMRELAMGEYPYLLDEAILKEENEDGEEVEQEEIEYEINN